MILNEAIATVLRTVTLSLKAPMGVLFLSDDNEMKFFSHGIISESEFSFTPTFDHDVIRWKGSISKTEMNLLGVTFSLEGQKGLLGILDQRTRESDEEIKLLNEFTEWIKSEIKLHLEEEQRRKFTQMLAHDLRNPLTAAKLNADILQNFTKDKDIHWASAKILRNIQRADHLIQSLQDATRIHLGEKLSVKLSRGDIRAIALEVLDEMNLQFGQRFELETTEKLECEFSLDAVRRILHHLLTNAGKYATPDSPVRLKCEVKETMAIISVHNSGDPIPQTEWEKIFEFYYRTPSALESGQKGWGLGLPLVRHLAHSHGGHVKLESSSDRGTIFTVHLAIKTK